MTELETNTLPEKWQGQRQTILIEQICAEAHSRLRAPDLGQGLAELAVSIARQGLLQPIGVKRTPTDHLRYDLIWGYRRIAAYFENPSRLGRTIEAVVYPPDLPEEWSTILEIDENLKRQDLTADERAEHSLRLAAEIRKLEEQASNMKSDLSGFSDAAEVNSKPTTGRGNKGIVQKVAERAHVDQAAVRKHARKVAVAIGEPVDLQLDTPAELARKAGKFKKTPKAGRMPKDRTVDGHREPSPQPRTGRADLVACLRQLDLAITTPLGAYAWAEDLPDFQRCDVLATVLRLQGKLALLLDALRGAEMPPADQAEVSEEKASNHAAPARANGDEWAARGARIREARIAKCMSIADLGMLACLHRQSVSMAERGQLTKTGGPAAGRPAYAKLEAALAIDQSAES